MSSFASAKISRPFCCLLPMFAGHAACILSRPHSLITGNICAKLHAHIKHRSCNIYLSNMRLKVSATGLYPYPDVMVVCDEVHTKKGPGRWLLAEFESRDDVIKLTSINCGLALKDVYLKVNFHNAGEPRPCGRSPKNNLQLIEEPNC